MPPINSLSRSDESINSAKRCPAAAMLKSLTKSVSNVTLTDTKEKLMAPATTALHTRY